MYISNITYFNACEDPTEESFLQGVIMKRLLGTYCTGTDMDYIIHINVEVVKIWNLKIKRLATSSNCILMQGCVHAAKLRSGCC